jgi:hypothetical protein
LQQQRRKSKLPNMTSEDRKQAAPRPVSEKLARSAAARRIQRKVIEQEANTLRDAMGRVQGRHKGYVMARAAGDSQAKAWSETISTVRNPQQRGAELESKSPAVRNAIEAVTAAAIKGSLMTVAQRRDYVLDRLIVESTAAGDSARIQALALLGKTANMFTDRQEISVIGGADAIASRIQQMIEAIQGRTIEHDNGLNSEHIYDAGDDDGLNSVDGLNDADDVGGESEDISLNDAQRLHDAAQPIDSTGEGIGGTGNADPTGEAPPAAKSGRSARI